MTSFDDVVDAAKLNTNSGSDLASAAGQIIAKRVALGVAAIIDPMRADHARIRPNGAGKGRSFLCCRHNHDPAG